MAFASIFVPDFILQAVVSAEPELHSCGVALLDGAPPIYNVVAINELAKQAGIQLGMSESQVAQFRGVERRHRSRTREQALHMALLDMCWSVSPRIEDTAVDTFILDFAGLHSAFGSEKKIASELVRRASALGLTINIGISTNIETAIHVARGFSGITLVRSGRESAILAGLPVSVLSPAQEIMESLERWGVRTCGDLAALPLRELSERLGQGGVRLHQLARGASVRSLVLAQTNTCFAEELELDDPVENLEPLSFLLCRLLDQLCARLKTYSLAASMIDLRFELGEAFEKEPLFGKASDAEVAPTSYETTLRLPVPVSDSKLLLNLLRLQLQTDPPQASIVKLSLSAEPARRRASQRDFFRPQSIDPEKLELTIARLSSLVGAANVGMPEVLNTHRPGAFRMNRFVQAAKELQSRRKPADLLAIHDDEQSTAQNRPVIGLRMFRPEWLARIELRKDCPAQISFRGLCGKIVMASGPWRSSGDWWRENAWHDEEWDIHVCFPSESSATGEDRQSETHDGLYSIYYDPSRHNWYVRGKYD